MVSSLLSALALLSALHSVPTAAAEDSGLSWTIYHSWNPNQDFVRRGSLAWGPTKSNGNGNGNGDEATSDNSNGNGNGNEKEFRIINDGDSANLKGTDIREMLEYGWYHVKIQSQTDENRFVFQTVPACNLRRANFKDQFEITLPRSTAGDQQDPLTSFAYTPLVSPLAPADCADYNDDDIDNDEEASTTKSFSSRVSVQLDTPAMILKAILSQPKPPPGIAFVKQPQQQGQSRGGGTAGNGDNYEDPEAPPTPPGVMGFFSKYWYIILPVMILQVLQAPEDPPPGQQQQQGQQQQGGTIAPQASGSAAKARRGKTSRN